MKRALLLVVLVAGCSKAAPPPSPLRATIGRAREILGEFGKLEARFTALSKAPATPESTREIESIQEAAGEKGDQLKAALASLGASADLGLKTTPDDPDLLEARWIVANVTGDDEKAGAALDRLAALKPDDPVVTARRAEQLRKKGKYGEARALLAAALGKRADDPNLLAEDAASAEALNEFDAAVSRLAAAAARRDRLELPILREYDLLVSGTKEEAKAWAAETAIRAAEAKADDLPRVRLETSKGAIVLELFENEAPNTVANFVDLVDRQYYDGTKFHRVIADFMAQGGDPLSRNETEDDDGSGGPGYQIADELPEGKYRRHFRASLSMANSGADTGGSQFFITVRPTGRLDGKHVVFGRVLEGMNVVDAIAKGDALIHAVVVRKRDHSYRPAAKD